jgi:nucleoside-diphosphate-sugar epimerase
MDILVTGSNGFLAKNIITKLKNYNFITVSRNELDLTNKIQVDNFFQKNFFDVVINTAIVGGRRSIADSKDIFYDNVLISMNIAENRASYKKIITCGICKKDNYQNVDFPNENDYDSVWNFVYMGYSYPLRKAFFYVKFGSG